jgi:hypothetical protein
LWFFVFVFLFHKKLNIMMNNNNNNNKKYF